jgi:hypothetical protein
MGGPRWSAHGRRLGVEVVLRIVNIQRPRCANDTFGFTLGKSVELSTYLSRRRLHDTLGWLTDHTTLL